MAEQSVVLIVQLACHEVQPTVQHIKAGKTHIFRRDPISNKGAKEEFIEDGTDIHRGSSDECNREV